MTHNILLTGVSGYLGGTLLSQWPTPTTTTQHQQQQQPSTNNQPSNFPSYDKLYVLVRTPAQATAVKNSAPHAEPLIFDPDDGDAVREIVVGKRISVVVFLIDAFGVRKQRNFIEALGVLRRDGGVEVAFMHVSSLRLEGKGEGGKGELGGVI